MNEAPKSFVDPDQRPTIFDPVEEKPISLYGQTGFLISFSVDPAPRAASLLSMVVKHSGVFYADQNIYTSSDIVQNIRGESLTFELYADNRDVASANFNLRVPKITGGYYFNPCGHLMGVRQPTVGVDVQQIFSMTASTQTFNKYNYLGVYYYPTATLRLNFLSHLDNFTPPWPPPTVTLPDKIATSVTVAQKNTNGIMDITAEVRIKWYSNAQRTNEVFPPGLFTQVGCSFGLRFYVAKGGDFLERCEIVGDGGVVSGVYPTSYLVSIGQPAMSLFYWVGGTLGSDIYKGQAPSVIVSDNGLPMQGLTEVGVYILPNPLPDIYSSSSSDSSSTIASSMSSSSVSSSSSTYRSLSTSSASSSSSSSTEALSSSSSSSPSSSTEMMSSSSSSSLGSISSFSVGPVLRYSFATQPLAQEVIDVSGNRNDAVMGLPSTMVGPPVWGVSYGVSGGGFQFFASLMSSDYIQGTKFNGMTGCTRGTISIWIKPMPNGNSISVPFCISNGFVAVKTELDIRINSGSGVSTVFASLTTNNVLQWVVRSSVGVLPDGQWTNIVLQHDSRTPRLFINGSENWVMVQSTNKRKWLKDIFSAVTSADRLILGGVPRYYQPFVALGFNGFMDEITIWDVPLSSSQIIDIVESSSNSTSSITVS